MVLVADLVVKELVVNMLRKLIDKRKDWQSTVEKQGLLYHTSSQAVIDKEASVSPYRQTPESHMEKVKTYYWDESVYYSFKMDQVNQLEIATNKLHSMCLEAVQHIIDKNRYKELHIPDIAIPLIQYSWDNETPAIYGRFDFGYDGVNPPKLYEYNADTPTSLLEAAVIQWYWKEDCFKHLDQFNSIHERLIAKWKELKEYLMHGPLYFGHLDNWEDAMNSAYMADTANQAGIEIDSILMSEIQWHAHENIFVDSKENTIRNLFKLYPWEWLLKEEFGQHIPRLIDEMCWIEPPWKMILSNKGILPILSEMFPGHENLLKSSFRDNLKLDNYVKKPYFSREGQGVTIYYSKPQCSLTHGPEFVSPEGYIFQETFQAKFDDVHYPVVGSWVIDGQSAGIGIRESIGPITDNSSRFVPHVIEG